MAKIYKGNGYFETSDVARGELSGLTRLQDGEFYQYFSYVIKSPVSIDRWKDIVLKTTHPAGMKVFGEVDITSQMNLYQGEAKDYQNFSTSVAVIGPVTANLADTATPESEVSVYTQTYVYTTSSDPFDTGALILIPYFAEDYVANIIKNVVDSVEPSGTETITVTGTDNVTYV